MIPISEATYKCPSCGTTHPEQGTCPNPVCNSSRISNPPGLYLRLFHGRVDPDEDLEDWGFDGPHIGPLKYVHGTYTTELAIEFLDAEETAGMSSARSFGIDPSTPFIKYHEDLLCLHGLYYGDFSVYYHAEEIGIPEELQ